MALRSGWRAVACAAAMMWGTAGAEAVTLNAGDTYQLELTGFVADPTGLLLPNFAALDVNFVPSRALGPGEQISYSIYENSVAEAPVFTGTLGDSSGAYSGITFGTVNLWQDLQGAISLTMLSGSVDLDSILGRVNKDGVVYRYHLQIAPLPPPPSAVPLPAAAPLFGAALAVMGFVGWTRKRYGTPRAVM